MKSSSYNILKFIPRPLAFSERPDARVGWRALPLPRESGGDDVPSDLHGAFETLRERRVRNSLFTQSPVERFCGFRVHLTCACASANLFAHVAHLFHGAFELSARLCVRGTCRRLSLSECTLHTGWHAFLENVCDATRERGIV